MLFPSMHADTTAPPLLDILYCREGAVVEYRLFGVSPGLHPEKLLLVPDPRLVWPFENGVIRELDDASGFKICA